MIKYNIDLIKKHDKYFYGISWDAYDRLLNNHPVDLATLIKVADKLEISLKEIMWYEKED